MQVILAAMGGGAPGTMTAECAGALAAAECVVGARRLLAALPAGCTARRVEAARPQEVLQAVLEARGYASLCVVAYSGDTGFYSGACGLLPLLAEKRRCGAGAAGHFQRAAFGRASGPPLAGLDARLRPRRGVRRGCGGVRRQTGVFPHGRHARPGSLCAQLCEAGLGGLAVTVGENLSYPDERVTQATAAQCAQGAFAPLSVLLAEAAPRARSARRALRTARLHAGRCR